MKILFEDIRVTSTADAFKTESNLLPMRKVVNKPTLFLGVRNAAKDDGVEKKFNTFNARILGLVKTEKY